MKRIYRVEHGRNGDGPYQSYRWRNRYEQLHGQDRSKSDRDFGVENPPWHLDSLGSKVHFNFKHQFGFSSKKKARRWFDRKDAQALQDEGYVLVRIEAEEAYHARTQSIYIPGGRRKVLGPVFDVLYSDVHNEERKAA